MITIMIIMITIIFIIIIVIISIIIIIIMIDSVFRGRRPGSAARVWAKQTEQVIIKVSIDKYINR